MGGAGDNTRVEDHYPADYYTAAEKRDTVCVEQEHVDESCVNNALSGSIGKPMGAWSPWNNCITYTNDVLRACSTMSGSPTGPNDIVDVVGLSAELHVCLVRARKRSCKVVDGQRETLGADANVGAKIAT